MEPSRGPVQQAYAAWNVAGGAVTAEAGLFLSPIGPESMPVKDGWNFSRSNLFYGLPFYHTGVRVGWQATEGVKLTGAVLYFGGPERAEGAPEGAAWRHLGDLWVQLDATSRLSLLAHADLGLEDNEVGVNTWAAGALYARAQPIEPLYVVVRGDWFGERATGGAGALFWPNATDGEGRVASGTLTLDWRPVSHLSLRLEGRHDTANAPMFFEDSDVMQAETQDTVTTGIVAWF